MTIMDNPTSQAVTASVIYVDPQMARNVLARNTNNRPISERHVNTLMQEMATGRWNYNGEAIKWSVDNVLLDGQHRLTALSRMPDSFGGLPFLVVRGLPPESQNTMDQGRKRSAADQLVLAGLTDRDSQIVASAIRVYITWTSGNLFRDAKFRPSNPEVVEWAEEHPAELRMLAEITTDKMKRIKCRPSVTAAVLLALRIVDEDDQIEFADLLQTGANLEQGSPILALRDKLDRIRETKVKTTERDIIGFFITAWNLWRDDKLTALLRRPANGGWTKSSFPRPH